MRFNTAATERMRLTSNGELVIGATSPTSSALLTVSGAGGTTGSIDPTLAVVSTGTGSSDDAIIMARIGGTSASSYIFFGDSGDADAGRIRYAHNGDHMIFYTAGTERMRINSTGLGIGTSTLDYNKAVIEGGVAGTQGSTLALKTGNGTSSQVADLAFYSTFYNYPADTTQRRSADITSGFSTGIWGTEYLAFGVGGAGDPTNLTTERMRITASGNVGIGTVSPSVLLHLDDDSNSQIMFGNTTHGYKIRANVSGFADYGLLFEDEDGVDLYRIVSSTGPSGYRDTHTFYTAGSERLRIDASGNVRPGADNTQDLGSSLYRWSEVFAGTGTINTSDQREKTEIADLNEAERRVATALKGLVKKYRFKDAVAAKGDNARIHVGVIAQEVVAAFSAEGLDATRYALLCHDEWDAAEEVLDDDGEVVTPALAAGDRYGIRYDELLAFIISAL